MGRPASVRCSRAPVRTPSSLPTAPVIRTAIGDRSPCPSTTRPQLGKQEQLSQQASDVGAADGALSNKQEQIRHEAMCWESVARPSDGGDHVQVKR
jgi:hypothetical protein